MSMRSSPPNLITIPKWSGLLPHLILTLSTISVDDGRCMEMILHTLLKPTKTTTPSLSLLVMLYHKSFIDLHRFETTKTTHNTHLFWGFNKIQNSSPLGRFNKSIIYSSSITGSLLTHTAKANLPPGLQTEFSFTPSPGNKWGKGA